MTTKKYYEYWQNNSGGGFESPAVRVYIEADTPEEADNIAVENGIYFNGVELGLDCECCGERWYQASEHSVTDKPEPTDNDNWWSERSGIPPILVIEKVGF